jgi:SAM-dependent methyltransferase
MRARRFARCPVQGSPVSPEQPAPDPGALVAGQRQHWETTFAANPQMYGTEPSEAGRSAASRFAAEGLSRVLELGAGQGRDTFGLLGAGLEVTALDYAAGPLAGMVATATAAGLAERLTTRTHDVRRPLPFADASFDACYSHMLFTMALASDELAALAGEVHRVLRPGGLCIYTVRHVGDAHYGAGRDLGDNLFENGGFVVHFFDRTLVHRLAEGFELEDLSAFEEGDLPRRLWRIRMRRL